MKTLNLSLLSVVCLGVASVSAQGDLLRSVPEAVHLHIAPQSGWAGSVGTILPVASFSGFPADDFNRWLTLATGPEFVNLLGGHSAAFTGKLNPDKCSVQDVPFPILPVFNLEYETLQEFRPRVSILPVRFSRWTIMK